MLIFIDIQVYQEKAIKDKERYKAEMEAYCLKLKMSNVNNDAMPLQQRLPELDNVLVDVDIKLDENEVGSPQTPEDMSSSDGSDNEDDEGMDNDINMDASAGKGVGAEVTSLGSEKSSKKGDYEPFRRCEGEGGAGDQQVQKMDQSKTMFALF